jgi:phage baseplate assembly protein W
MADRYGTDLYVPDDPDEDVVATPTGDLRTITGRDNLLAAQSRRARVTPGRLVHRPEYGGGVTAAVDGPGDLASRARLQAQVRRNALRDDRVADVGVTVAQKQEGVQRFFEVALTITEPGEETGSVVIVGS